MTKQEHEELAAIYAEPRYMHSSLLATFLAGVMIDDAAPSGNIRPGMERAKAIIGELSVKPPQNPAEQMMYDAKAPVLAQFQAAACRLIDQELDGMVE